MRFVFETDGETLVSREILRFGERAGHMKPAFEKVADDMMGAERGLFDAQGRGQWKPIQPQTIARKRKAGLDPRILHATRTLRRSLTERGADHQQLVVTDDFLVFGSDLGYAGIQKRHGRPPLRFTEQEKRDFVKRLQRYLATGDV